MPVKNNAMGRPCQLLRRYNRLYFFQDTQQAAICRRKLRVLHPAAGQFIDEFLTRDP